MIGKCSSAENALPVRRKTRSAVLGLTAPSRCAATSTHPAAVRLRAWICRKKLLKCLEMSLKVLTFAPGIHLNTFELWKKTTTNQY